MPRQEVSLKCWFLILFLYLVELQYRLHIVFISVQKKKQPPWFHDSRKVMTEWTFAYLNSSCLLLIPPLFTHYNTMVQVCKAYTEILAQQIFLGQHIHHKIIIPVFLFLTRNKGCYLECNLSQQDLRALQKQCLQALFQENHILDQCFSTLTAWRWTSTLRIHRIIESVLGVEVHTFSNGQGWERLV